MSILQILQIIVLLLTIATGLLCFINPWAIRGFTGLEMPGVRGVSEVRAGFGGLFIGLGAAPLVLGAHAAYQVVGIGYLAIGIARLCSIIYDRSTAQSNNISLVVEIVFGVILVL